MGTFSVFKTKIPEISVYMLILLAAVSFGCPGIGEDEPPLQVIDDDDDDTGGADAPTWENFARVFFTDYCNQCHSSDLDFTERSGATVGVDYNTYALAVQNSERAKARVVEGTMPPSGSPMPSEGQKQKLIDWVDAGTPEM